MIVVSNLEKLESLNKEESKKCLSKALKFFRTSKNVSQNQLAKHLGTNFQKIQKYENGKNKVPFERLIKICNFLNGELDKFLKVAFQN